jgi:hypothetical protein
MSIILISGFLLEGPSLGGFEGFDLTNPRGRFGGERFHLACPKLGLEDAILFHTILVRFYISAGGRVSSNGGASLFEGSLFQGIGRASVDSSTRVFIAGAWPLDLVHSGRVSWAIWVMGCIG